MTASLRQPLSLPRRAAPRLLLAGCALAALAACSNMDADLRGFGKLGFDTSSAARSATAARPEPDSRGVISYPNFQVAVARRGDTVATVATRAGVNAEELARYNAISSNTPLNKGEVLALPRRVAEPVATAQALPTATAPTATGTGTERIDITSLASSAIDRAAASSPAPATPSATTAAPAPTKTAAAPVAAKPATGMQPASAEPVRHKVARGETAYTIARYYNVSAKALAEWNGLPADLSVREGQYLLIPVATAGAAPASASTVTPPGAASPTPEPPSASKPLPAESPVKASTPVDTSGVPDLGATRTAASSGAQLVMPVGGSIIRPYVKGKNDGIDIAAAAGTAIKAADAGTVAAITKDTEQVPILVLRHANGLLTVYANIDGIAVKKGDTVKRGQAIAKIRAGEPAFVHFEVRKGYDSVDPVPYLQ